MSVSESLWILVIGMVFQVLILVFIVVFFIHTKISVTAQCNDCLRRIKEIETEISNVNKIHSNVKDILYENKEVLDKVQKLL